MNISQQLKTSFPFFSFGWQCWLALLLCSISVWSTAQNVQSKSTQVNGHSYDQNYLKWKAQQAAQDQRLAHLARAADRASCGKHRGLYERDDALYLRPRQEGADRQLYGRRRR